MPTPPEGLPPLNAHPVSEVPLPRGHTVDILLLLMTVIWGSNFAVVKSAFRELNPHAFNAMRMTIAAVAFLAIMAVVRRLRPRAEAAQPAGGGDVASIFHTPARVTPVNGSRSPCSASSATPSINTSSSAAWPGPASPTDR